MRKGFCITSDESTDNFVGIRFIDGNPTVIFPHGYNIPDDDKERRQDVFKLLRVLQIFSQLREGESLTGPTELLSSMPISSCQYIIQDYLARGYYREKEIKYISDSRGKISWKRTIQNETPVINSGNVVYLRFNIQKPTMNENNLISQIHKYCVYESFRLFGWLYFSSDLMPEKPHIKRNDRIFFQAIQEAMNNTFDDKKKKLFISMKNVLQYASEDTNFRNCSIGVNKFEGVWERLIDHVFGEAGKDKYFPHAEWYIFKNGHYSRSSALEPDTIMKYRDKIYILDAKYYQYGVTEDPFDLPNTSSIQKQITYGKHVEQMHEVDGNNIYNAFVMPYNGELGEYALKFVSVGIAKWEEEQDRKNYSYVLGLLLDTRHLVTTYIKHNDAEIVRLADKIEESLDLYKEQVLHLYNKKPTDLVN